MLLFRLGQKFGADPSLTKGLLETAQALELQVVGVSFHVGSGQAGRQEAVGSRMTKLVCSS